MVTFFLLYLLFPVGKEVVQLTLIDLNPTYNYPLYSIITLLAVSSAANRPGWGLSITTHPHLVLFTSLANHSSTLCNSQVLGFIAVFLSSLFLLITFIQWLHTSGYGCVIQWLHLLRKRTLSRQSWTCLILNTLLCKWIQYIGIKILHICDWSSTVDYFMKTKLRYHYCFLGIRLMHLIETYNPIYLFFKYANKRKKR